MKKLIIRISLILPTIFFGQEWTNSFGGSFDEGYSVQQTSDGGYIVGGTTFSYGNGGSDVYLIKTDENGQELWSQTFGGTENDYGYSVEQTSDGGYIIVGETYSYGNGGRDVYLVKTDENGQELWSHTFGGTSDDYGKSVQQTNDGGYIVCGTTFSTVGWTFGNGTYLVYLIKTDQNGQEVWSQTYGTSNSEWGYSVQQTNDGGFIITGNLSTESNSDVYLIKTDQNGQEEWTQTFGGSGIDIGSSVQQTNDGGYVVCGTTSSPGDGQGQDVYLIKTDQNGQETWSKTFGGSNSDEGYSVQQTNDGGFIITGRTQTDSPYYDVYLIKTNINGQEEWTQTFGGIGNDGGISVQQTNDGGYIISGYTSTSMNNNQINVFLIKLLFPTTYFETDLVGCDSVQSIVDGTFFNSSGSYVDTLTNITNIFNGDSVVIQNILIDNNLQGYLITNSSFVELNEIRTYIIQNYNWDNTYSINITGGELYFNTFGETFEVSWNTLGLGVIDFVETTSFGCSDTTSYEIDVQPPYYWDIIDYDGCDSVLNICTNEYVYESTNYEEYYFTNQFGGDSIIGLTLTVYPSPENVLINGNTNVTPSTLEYYQITTITDNNLDWNIEGGSIFQNSGNIIEVLWGNEGVGVVELIETDIYGCSTINSLEVNISDESTSIDELTNNRKLIKTINVLGNEIKPKSNTILIQFYDDGTVEKKLIIE